MVSAGGRRILTMSHITSSLPAYNSVIMIFKVKFEIARVKVEILQGWFKKKIGPSVKKFISSNC